ncbi:hypothetical protein [Micromonospora sp. RTP1Z1]|uniref:dihydrofolate reductase family protein n=1 Tax=Micromonospora sp. RTP1Z1 TaxID=2994043 RepID=UPI0029C61A62|nr:hypothetical protein [Micromonospora sp. RTP1Z1]
MAFVAGPGGELDWMWAAFDTHLMGRVNFQGQAAQRPHSTGEIATPMNDASTIAFSGSLDRVGWRNARLATADPATEIAWLKQQPGRTSLSPAE